MLSDLLDGSFRSPQAATPSSARGESVVVPRVCFHALFEEQVRRTPGRRALACADRRLTYAELEAQANRVARLLRARGVGRDVRVGLCMERSASAIVALLGILKAGGAYVPLVPEHPEARLLQQIEEADARVVITDEKILPRLPGLARAALCLDRDASKIEAMNGTALNHVNAPEDLAYVIYTSGSSGVPKGVCVTHANLVNYTLFMMRRLGLAAHPEGLSFASVSTLAADLGSTSIFPALASGGCLDLVTPDVAMDARLLSEHCATSPVDVLKITPSHLSALLGAGSGAGVLPRRYLVLGGEALSWELARRVLGTARCEVLNHYGPTETTIGALTWGPIALDGSAEPPCATVPIGRPIDNAEVHVLDERLAPVPAGEPGELYIGGAGVTRGYLNQPEETARRFVDSPFAAGTRLYRTGDRVRALPDGSIEFLGRVDQQVKIRGFRVEPAEVEAALRRAPGIRDAAVAVRGDAYGEPKLVAYVAPMRRPGPSEDELHAFLQRILPEHMIPPVIQEVDALPLSQNGKIDRGALPPERERTSHALAPIPPRDPVEQAIARIWGEVLRVPGVGVRDNFFKLGGHSLHAVQVIARVREELRVDLRLGALFEGATVEALARAVAAERDQARNAETTAALEALEGMSEEEAQKLLEEEADA